MINRKDNPVEWALLSYELEDTVEHLQALSNQVNSMSGVDPVDFEIQLGHIYAHLNRIWNSRNHVGEQTSSDFEKYSEFPNDIKLT